MESVCREMRRSRKSTGSELEYANYEHELARSAKERLQEERGEIWERLWLESPRDAVVPLGGARKKGQGYPEECVVKLDQKTRERLLTTLRAVEWPGSVRKYVQGRSECVGLTCSTGKRPRINVQREDMRQAVKKLNGALGSFYARQNWNVFWTALQVNHNTVADWHVDYKNDGMSTMVVVGEFTGGAFSFGRVCPC